MRTLKEIEADFSQRINQIDLLSELNASAEEIDKFAHNVRHWTDQYSITKLCDLIEKQYPCCLAVYLVERGITGYEQGDYWSTINKDLVDNQMLRHRLREFFRRFLEERELPISSDKQRYINHILLHGGIPNNCLNDFFKNFLHGFALKNLSNNSSEEVQAIIEEWLINTSKQIGTDQPIVDFLKYGGKFANNFVARCLEMAQYYEEYDSLLKAPEFGLPNRIIEAYRGWIEKNKTNLKPDNRTRLQPPALWFDPYGAGLLLDLPSQTLRLDFAPDGKWIVEIGNETESLEFNLRPQRDFDGWKTFKYKNELLPPAIEYTITFDDGNELKRSWHFRGLSDEAPIMAFDAETCKLERWQRVLPAKNLLLVYKNKQKLEVLEADQQDRFSSLNDSWVGYKVENWNLTQNSQIKINNQTYEVELDFEQLKPFLNGVTIKNCQLPYTNGNIFADIPTLIIPTPPGRQPENEAKRWFLRLIEKDKTSESSSVALEKLPFQIENNDLTLSLSALGCTKSGSYDLELRGPLGRDTKFSFGCVKGLQVKIEQPLRYPIETGEIPPAIFFVELQSGYKIETTNSHFQIKKVGTNLFEIVATSDITVAKVEVLNSEADYKRSIVIEVPLPALQWRIISNSSRSNDFSHWQKQLICLTKAWLKQNHDCKLFIISNPATTIKPNEVELILKSDNHQELQQLKPRGRIGQELFFNLSEASDTIRTSQDSFIYCELTLRNLPQELEKSVTFPIVRIEKQITLKSFEINGELVENEWLIEVKWQSLQQLHNRYIRLWSLWKPWLPPHIIAIPDEAIDSHLFIANYKDVTVGEYLAEMVLLDEWTKQSAIQNKRPLILDSSKKLISIGDSAEFRVITNSLKDVNGILTSILAIKESERQLKLLQNQLGQFLTSSNVEKLLETLLVLMKNFDLSTESQLFREITLNLMKFPLEILAAFVNQSLPRLRKEREILEQIAYQISPNLHDLLRQIIQWNYLSIKDLSRLVPKLEHDENLKTNVKQLFQNFGINILDEIDQPNVNNNPINDEFEKIREEVEQCNLTTPLPTLTAYLREIAGVKPLTVREERKYLEEITDGRTAREEMNSSLALDPNRQQMLQTQVEKAENARKLLSNANLQLAVVVARKNTKKRLFDLEALVEMATEPLMEAIRDFDPKQQKDFTTFATERIEKAIQNNSRKRF